jgi:hypothetical protein
MAVKFQGGKAVPFRVPALENARKILMGLPKKLKETTMPPGFFLEPMNIQEQPGYHDSRVGIRMQRTMVALGKTTKEGIIFKDIMDGETLEQFMRRHYLVKA